MKYVYLSWLFFLTLGITKGQEFTVQPITDWQFKSIGSTTWNKAQVPGTVHTDLLDNKLISDPFYGTNEQQLQWIGDSSWEYQTTISITKKQLKQEHIELTFDGLDTYAKIWVNNRLVATANNMFRSWSIELKPLVAEGKNTIRVVFESNQLKAKALAKQLPYTLPGEDRVHVRKAQYHFGWDWGPKLVTCGIWKPVYINTWSNNKINSIQVIPQLNQTNKANVDVRVNLANSCQTQLRIELYQGEQLLSQQTVKTSSTQKSVSFTIQQPKLWWCNGIGEQNLYHVKVELLKQHHEVAQNLQTNFGIRDIELVQQLDSIGSSFYFKLNGRPVFAKGANVIPFDVFLPRVTNKQYETIIKQAVEANMNMIRVWGGGVYERDEFYDLCDKYGLLVWQDFMFACGMYPGDEGFLTNVKEEVTEQVVRLRNHPSIVLWCGNNENMEGWVNWGWQKQYGYSQTDSMQIARNYDTLFHRIIPSILSKFDNQRPYHPSSPANGWGKAKSLTEGDVHYWGVWWGMQPFSAYQNKIGRFVSEYGFQSMASETCMATVIPEQERNLSSPSSKNHQKHPTGYETITQYAKQYFTIPNSIDSFRYVSQVTQAIGMKTAIEAHRIHKPYCMGSLYWQLNDCWPVTSWSTTDYALQPKAAYYRIKQAFSPVAILAKMDSTNIQLHALSDLPVDTLLEVQVKAFDANGNILKVHKQLVEFKANSISPFTNLNTATTPSTSLIKISILSSNHIVWDEYLPYPNKPITQASKVVVQALNDSTIQVSVDKGFAQYIELKSNRYTFKENYIDLVSGETKYMRVHGPTPIDLNQIQVLYIPMKN